MCKRDGIQVACQRYPSAAVVENMAPCCEIQYVRTEGYTLVGGTCRRLSAVPEVDG